ncbi:NUDIX domain-containing protein [Actinocorallia aurea]
MAPAALADDPRTGNRLDAFLPAGGPPRRPDVPTPAALVAVWHGSRLLPVHDRHRAAWELPGGGIEPGETPHDAASLG